MKNRAVIRNVGIFFAMKKAGTHCAADHSGAEQNAMTTGRIVVLI